MIPPLHGACGSIVVGGGVISFPGHCLQIVFGGWSVFTPLIIAFFVSTVCGSGGLYCVNHRMVGSLYFTGLRVGGAAL